MSRITTVTDRSAVQDLILPRWHSTPMASHLRIHDAVERQEVGLTKHKTDLELCKCPDDHSETDAAAAALLRTLTQLCARDGKLLESLSTLA